MKKVLIANRGEIAVRVMRTCRELGLATVAVYSDADRGALHVRTADEAVRIGPAPSRESYLRIEAILAAAKQTGADAIHPGYGFLSEKAEFARACEAAGVTLIGPPASAMDEMGEKTRARRAMQRAGVPVVPGLLEPVADPAEALRKAAEIGYPVMLKAAAGGGGKGMRLVFKEEDFLSAFRSAGSEALSAFGDGSVYIERAVTKPRHVEIQIFADQHGNCVYLGERECSVQRRHQKVIEETPSPVVTKEMRRAMGEVAVKGALAVGYVGAGTFEFLVNDKREFFFLEMNTRLQVEHPVTEWCTGFDLVAWQLRVAQGEKLPVTQAQIAPRGHSIEARVYAEDPAKNFMPSPGRIEDLVLPSGPGVRNDVGVYPGAMVPIHYDPMIGKLAVWADTREAAIARLDRALSEYVVRGITTNIRYLRAILALPEFRAGDYDTSILGRNEAALFAVPPAERSDLALVAAAVHQHQRDDARRAEVAAAQGPAAASPWRLAARPS